MTFPDDVLPKPPILRDGLDSLTTSDLQSVEDNLTGLQSEFGLRPDGQSRSMGGLFRDNCRIATGNFSGSYQSTGSHTVTVNGNTFTYDEGGFDNYWRFHREYFLADRSDSLFTEQPIIYYQPRKPFAASVAANYISLVITKYVSKSLFVPFGTPTMDGSATDIYFNGRI